MKKLKKNKQIIDPIELHRKSNKLLKQTNDKVDRLMLYKDKLKEGGY